ncbi:cytochrome P450 [Apodospora peruviana]|uniref:Cytochrome P450 n=1 Tax=Apodospora peruviana TaxID=516989 RepID=A0AAE0HTC7_9PEZI|nr:cytochrome P450 [Apodospora peruviana]
MLYTTSDVKAALAELPFSAFAAAAGVLIFVAFLIREFKSWYRLKHIPGPFLNGISSFPMVRMAGSGRMCFQMRELGNRYGPLVRIGPNEVVFGDADTFRMITGARSPFVKSPWFGASRHLPDQHSIVSMSDEDEHKIMKGKLAPGYSDKEASGSFETGVDKYVATFIDLIERKYISTSMDYRPMEFSHKAQYFALDVITEVGFGEAFGFLTNDRDMYQYVEINDTYLPVLVMLLELPFFDNVLRTWPMNKLAPTAGDDYGYGKLMGLMTDIVDKRLKPDAEQGNDMLASHIRSGLNRKELLAEVFVKVMAGADSTAMAIRMMLLFLLTTPTALSTLRAEIDDRVASGQISSPFITHAEANSFPYLQAVVKETLRLYPPITGHNYKLVPAGGATILGHFLPAGTQIGLNHVQMLRNKKVFGADAEIFRPERWVEADGTRFKEMSANVDLVFSHGKYYCLGRNLAQIEMNKVVAELVRRFDFTIADPVVPITVKDCAFWVCSDFWVRVTRREKARMYPNSGCSC